MAYGGKHFQVGSRCSCSNRQPKLASTRKKITLYKKKHFPPAFSCVKNCVPCLFLLNWLKASLFNGLAWDLKGKPIVSRNEKQRKLHFVFHKGDACLSVKLKLMLCALLSGHIRQIQECRQMKLDTLQKRVEKSPLLKSFIGINHFKRSSLLSMIFWDLLQLFNYLVINIYI